MGNAPSTLIRAAVAAAVLCASGAAAADRVVTNTARIEWQAGGNTQSTPSNTVSLTVEAPPPAVPTVSLWEPNREGSVRLALDGSRCGPAGGMARTTFGGQALGTQAVAPLSTLTPGRPLVVAIDSPDSNRDPSASDSLTVRVTTPAGDTEELVLAETEANSGRFAALVATAPVPPPVTSGDCVLSFGDGSLATLVISTADGKRLGAVPVTLRPSNVKVVFDADTGKPIPAIKLTLLDAATGQPAIVYRYDGVTRASSIVQSAGGDDLTPRSTDPRGTSGSLPLGGFRFPVVTPGEYLLLVDPPAPYRAPSTATPAQIALIGSYRIERGSFGRRFTVGEAGELDFDVPLDHPGSGLVLTKTASTAVASASERILYTLTLTNIDRVRRSGEVHVTDLLPEQLRLVADSVRVDSGTIRTSSPDGRDLRFDLPALAPSESRTIRYLTEVRPNARAGPALNRAQATDDFGSLSQVADAIVRIERDNLTGRLTIVGRVTDGGCATDPAAVKGVAGVRVLMEDGSFAVTDPDGRYHLDGVRPGTHVVQLDSNTLPEGRVAIDCTRSTRSAGSATSRFVRGSGGALARADFRVTAGDSGERLAARTLARPPIATEGFAAGGEGRDWLADQTPGVAWLFPGDADNPRAKVIRVVVKHHPGQVVTLRREGEAVDALNSDGTISNADRTVAVTSWRGLALTGRDTRFTAEVRDEAGALVETLTRTVHFAEAPVRARLLPDRSLLIADGVSRPVMAIRLTDSAGRPVHHGLTGSFAVPDPYLPAQEAEALQRRQLGGLERAPATWRVEGDDGVAYVELMPTTASGSLTLTLPFADGGLKTEERLDLWLDPGERPWTLVGLAEGSIGRAAIDDHLEPLDTDRPLLDGRLALYAKGRVLGRWLLTASYDTDKERDDTRFGGVIDPTTYDTVYADGSERLFDAASIRKLYLKLERPQFAALFGDYRTGIDRPELTRYIRAFNGVRAQFDGEALGGRLAATAFAADTAFRTGRAEIQGSGLSGPYNVGTRDLVPNGERVAIEVHDRLRSNLVIERRELRRYLDYEIDYRTGSIRFREPITSRDLGLNPQFIVVDYESARGVRRVLNAGGRAGWTSPDETLAVAATVIHDREETGASDIVGADVRFRPLTSTEIRAELALSRGQAVGEPGVFIRGDAVAWLIEAEHHVANLDLLGYARQQDEGFGIGQQNRSERASRKFGLDGRYRLTRTLSLTGSAASEEYLDSDARRIAVRAGLDWTREGRTLRAGLAHVDDRTPGGGKRRSTLIELAGRQRVSDRLELDAKAELALGGQDDSIDYPQRLAAGARWRATDWLDLIGAYEIVTGGSVDAGTARAGFELRPWAGARIAATGNRQSIGELGTRTYAAFGLAQSLPVTPRLTLDTSFDANTTLGEFDRSAILNPQFPVATGGYVGAGDRLTEDFVAATLGGTWRADVWSVTGRAEVRRGSAADRWGLTLGGIRQLGDGRSLGGRLIATSASDERGTETRTVEASAAIALRPAGSTWSLLNRFDYREDDVTGAVRGALGPVGGERLTVNGDARSRRLVNSLSVNWTPTGGTNERTEMGELRLFLGTRTTLDRYDDLDVGGFSLVGGADAEFDVTKRLSLGGQASVRSTVDDRARAFAYGPRATVSLVEGTAITLGYNIAGFRDRDFEDARATRKGVFVTARVKFDADTLAGLFN